MKEGLIPHLFRTEYTKIVSVLCKRFGFDQMEIAEDIASDTFLTAMQSWGLEGIPKNPTAWLYHVSKNKAKNYLHREFIFGSKVSEEIKKNTLPQPEQELDLSPQNISDSQLQMMFALSHPGIQGEGSIGLSLRILCGFGIEEIANAFLTNKETINKRLLRAKEKLREEKIKIEFPPIEEIDGRLASVLRTIYLLFNEGYYSSSQDKTMRKDLCFEAIRLCTMLIENSITNKPDVNALMSLMCFHASRLDARSDENGDLILYEDQDTALWNVDLISKGVYFLNKASSGNKISAYHLEAGIAFWHTRKDDTKEKWDNILQLYNHLLQLAYSPVAALNRTYALSKANGKREAIKEAEKLKINDNHLYYILLGELYSEIDPAKAIKYYNKASMLTKSKADKLGIKKRLLNLGDFEN
jgi:RNA polymerase sigma factor (sigma-70 family)